jgi:hypothetical protein
MARLAIIDPTLHRRHGIRTARKVAGRVGSVSHQTTSGDVFAKLEHRGYAVANCQRGELFVLAGIRILLCRS